MIPRLTLLFLLLVTGLTGCAWLPGRDHEVSQVEGLLAYYHRLTTQTPDVQRREFLEAAAAFDRTQDDQNRLRLVMTLLLPAAPWRDDARAMQLLGAIDAASADRVSPRRDFVQFLEKMVQVRREEQRKSDALRDERRKADLLQQKLDSAREECHKADVLQQKLDELRDIDRDLRKRPGRRSRP
jgi:hypothetical protein